MDNVDKLGKEIPELAGQVHQNENIVFLLSSLCKGGNKQIISSEQEII